MSTTKTVSPQGRRGIAKAAGIIAFATLCSRILGFIRDIIIARFFGVYQEVQAFVVAFKLPNLFRDMLGEGAANAAFVPVFSEYATQRNREELWDLANVVLNLLAVTLMAVVLVGAAASGVLVPLIAPGFAASPEKLALAVALTRTLFPYLCLVSLAAYCMGLLNSLRHFTLPAFAPCFLNIAIIVCALIFRQDVRGLAGGVLIGGVLQLAVQIPALYRRGFRIRPLRGFRHPDARRIGRLLLPRIASSCLYQLNNFVDTVFGSLGWIVGSGGVAVLYFSYRMILFPLGVFSSALTQAALPTLSTQALDANRTALRATLVWGLRMSLFLLVPAAIGFMVLAYPVVETVFGGGRFDADSARTTALALFCYSIGLPTYGANRMLQTAFFALKDTKTPARIAGAALTCNVVLNAVLMYPLKIGGIALATSLASVLTFILLWVHLRRKLQTLALRELGHTIARIIPASLLMAGICWYTSRWWYVASGKLEHALVLSAIIILGVLGYTSACWFLRVQELHDFITWLQRRLRR